MTPPPLNMALPSDCTVHPNANGYYHCISHCLRWAWLCGYDNVNERLPRDRTVPPNTNGYYQRIRRCVRRAWLCGFDKVKDIDDGYRRKWVEERILLLTEAFAFPFLRMP